MSYSPEKLRRALHANTRGARRRHASASDMFGGISHSRTSRGVRVRLPGRVRRNMSAEDRKAILAAAKGIDTGAGRRRKSRKSKGKSRKSKKSAPTGRVMAGGRRPGRKSKPSGLSAAAARSRRSASAKRAWRKRRRAASAKSGGARKSRKSKGKARRRSRRSRRGSRRGRGKSAGFFWGSKQLRRTGHEYVDKYIGRGYMPAIARAGRLFDRQSIETYPISAGHIGRLHKRSVSRKSTRRGHAVGAGYRGARARRMAANHRRSRRSMRTNRRHRRSGGYRLHSNRRRSRKSRRSGRSAGWLYANRRRRSRRSRMSANVGVKYVMAPNRRRRSRRSMHANRRRSRRSMRANRRRSRRSRRLRPNLLAASKLRYSGRGHHRRGAAVGKLFQLVEPRRGSRTRGYPVLLPPQVAHGYVRSFRFGGAAKDAHSRRLSSPPRERRKYPKRRITKNSRRRRSMRRNPKYVVANRRRSRRVHRNRGRRGLRRNIFGADVMNDVLVPVGAGTAGFVAARLASNGIAQIGAVRGMLDSGAEAAGAENTKMVANGLAILATLGLATKVPMIRRHQGAIVTGMGLALADRLLGRVTGPAAAYLQGLGEYFEQPVSGMGEYFEQPVAGLGAYVRDPSAGMGEYFEQPVSGMGQAPMYATAGMGQAPMYATAGMGAGINDDPANQAHVDHAMDVAEAAAGVDQAAAGFGTMYATAGMGQASTPPVVDIGFRSTVTPTDVAAPITRDLPYAKPIETSLVTPEGKGYAGGLFARHLFGGMLSG
jgi:hypothetical protein